MVCKFFIQRVLASVAQLDARPTGDQEATGLTPAKVGDILSRAVVSFWRKNVHNSG